MATQSNAFMKNRVNWLLGNQNKGNAFYVTLRLFSKIFDNKRLNYINV